MGVPPRPFPTLQHRTALSRDLARSALRAADRCLPPRLIAAALTSAARREAERELPRRHDLLARLPASAMRRLDDLDDRALLALHRRAWNCRDRFHEPRWQRRIAWEGFEPVADAIERGRGVVLATLHFGAMEFLGRWLCARGLPTAVLVDDPDWISPARRRSPRGQRLAPRIIRPDQLRRAHRHLRRGGVLIAALDFPRGRTHAVPIEDRSIRLATGPLRLADTTGSVLVPALALPAPALPWHGIARFGPPAPLSADTAAHADALPAMMDWMMLSIRQHPHYCEEILLRRFEPAAALPLPPETACAPQSS